LISGHGTTIFFRADVQVGEDRRDEIIALCDLRQPFLP
jgi:hypothetical protein